MGQFVTRGLVDKMSRAEAEAAAKREIEQKISAGRPSQNDFTKASTKWAVSADAVPDPVRPQGLGATQALQSDWVPAQERRAAAGASRPILRSGSPLLAAQKRAATTAGASTKRKATTRATKATRTAKTPRPAKATKTAKATGATKAKAAKATKSASARGTRSTGQPRAAGKTRPARKSPRTSTR